MSVEEEEGVEIEVGRVGVGRVEGRGGAEGARCLEGGRGRGRLPPGPPGRSAIKFQVKLEFRVNYPPNGFLDRRGNVEEGECE